MPGLTDKLFVADADALCEVLRSLVAEAVAAVVERHALEVRELRRSLFVQKRLLTAHEAGHVLGGVAAATVMEYVREKGLPCYRPGKAPLFLVDDLVAWALRFPDAGGTGSLSGEGGGRLTEEPRASPFDHGAPSGERGEPVGTGAVRTGGVRRAAGKAASRAGERSVGRAAGG